MTGLTARKIGVFPVNIGRFCAAEFESKLTMLTYSSLPGRVYYTMSFQKVVVYDWLGWLPGAVSKPPAIGHLTTWAVP